jgi:orotidine-5'-phosphate decarboxylase
MTADHRLIVPLDVPTVAEAEALVASLDDAVSFYKVGLQLFASDGMGLARRLKSAGKSVFLDWKLHDIGATVEKATAAVVASGACDLLTVHAEPQVLAAAVKGRGGERSARILGVTVLTSLDDAALRELGYGLNVRELVERRIRQVLEAGADGVVASPHEAELARRIGGPDFLVVTPGVRPAGASLDDQARAATPASALKSGASHLVCGRPITAASDPKEAALAIVREMASA